jgi:hypothetical protein
VLTTVHTSTEDSRIAVDRDYDLRVLAAIAPTLGLFDSRSLEVQLRAMSQQRRAICFTVMSPVRKRSPHRDSPAMGIATVLVCLHVAPELAKRGPEALMARVTRAAAADAKPVHEVVAPISHATRVDAGGIYREAVYLDGDVTLALTTHTPVALRPETAAAVAAATQGAAIDIVTTVAITPAMYSSTGARRAAAPARPTLH